MSWTLCTCLMSLNCLNSKPRTWSTDIHNIKLHIWEQQLESCCGLQAFKDVFLFGLLARVTIKVTVNHSAMMESLHYPRVTCHFQKINTEERRQLCKKRKWTPCVHLILPFLYLVCWPKLHSNSKLYCVTCKRCFIERHNKEACWREWVVCDFPFLKVLFNPFGPLPLQLQEALKCQQCHKQFRSKAGLNYHTMAEHATKVHHMQTWAYLLQCLLPTMIPADIFL